jgi:hypothetical protein
VRANGGESRDERGNILIPVHQQVKELVQAGEDRRSDKADMKNPERLIGGRTGIGIDCHGLRSRWLGSGIKIELNILKINFNRSDRTGRILRKMHGQYPVSVVSRDFLPHGRLRDGETSTKRLIVTFDALVGLVVIISLPFSFCSNREDTSIQYHAYLIPLDSYQLNSDNELAFALDDIDERLPIRGCRDSP